MGKGPLAKVCFVVTLLWITAMHEGSAQAGTISGKVEINGQALASNVVVYLEGVPGKFSPPMQRPKMDHINLSFQPAVLPILKGTTVNFPNSDPVFHSAFSNSPSNPFELGIYPEGSGKSVEFKNAGEVEIFCHIHPYMHAFILVLENPHFALTDKEGNFTLAGVPKGTYKIKAWNGFFQAKETKTVTLGATQNLHVNFALQPTRVAGYP